MVTDSLQCRQFHRAPVNGFNRESAMLKLPKRGGNGGSQGKGGGGGEKRRVFFSPLPLPISFFRPHTYTKGYYFYSPQSSSVIKSKMAASSIRLTSFRPPKIRLHCRLGYRRPRDSLFFELGLNGSGLVLMFFHKMIPRTRHNDL